MPIPKYYELYRPFLDCLKDGQPHSFAEVNDYIALVMGLTEEDRKELLPSGTQSRFYNTVGWTRTYLKKAGLINSPTRGIFIITTEGKKLLEENPPIIDDKLLMRYNGFRSFMKIDSVGNEDNEIQDSSEDTPQNVMDKAFKIINNRLADELLSELMKKPPEFFELLVVKLLKNMGYGGTLEGSGSVVGKSGDEGIDGIIREDKLGFNLIYIQAKRWELEKTIGRPEIQKFVGALAGQGATKGLFITTARFTKEAYEYADKQHTTKVILVDGEMLANLMIEYNLGVTTESIYEIKRIDSDFFNDENSLI